MDLSEENKRLKTEVSELKAELQKCEKYKEKYIFAQIELNPEKVCELLEELDMTDSDKVKRMVTSLSKSLLKADEETPWSGAGVTPIIEAIERFFKTIERREPSVLKLLYILELMEETNRLDMERSKVYDFDGDKLVNAMDKKAQKCLKFVCNDQVILKRVNAIFNESRYKGPQEYGLYMELDMQAGLMAKELLDGADFNEVMQKYDTKPESEEEPPSKRFAFRLLGGKAPRGQLATKWKKA